MSINSSWLKNLGITYDAESVMSVSKPGRKPSARHGPLEF